RDRHSCPTRRSSDLRASPLEHKNNNVKIWSQPDVRAPAGAQGQSARDGDQLRGCGTARASADQSGPAVSGTYPVNSLSHLQLDSGGPGSAQAGAATSTDCAEKVAARCDATSDSNRAPAGSA